MNKYELWVTERGVRVLAHHLHAHRLGAEAEEEKSLRHPVHNHLQGVATLDVGPEGIALDGAVHPHPWVAPLHVPDGWQGVGGDGCRHIHTGG